MFNPDDISVDKDSEPTQPRLKGYPETLVGSQNRGFSSAWFDRYNFLEYSKKFDKIFCFACRHFLTDKSNALVKGSSNWTDLKRILEKHFDAPNSSHHSAAQKYLAYCQSKQVGSIVAQLDSQKKIEIRRNREVLAAQVDAVVYCVQQGISLRGHREDDDLANRGNFLELIEFPKRRCPEFAAKASKMPKNSTLLSWKM